MGKWWLTVCIVIMGLGCGGGGGGGKGSGGGDDTEPNTPEGKCETFINDYCGHIADCVIQDNLDPGHTRAQESEACIQSAGQSLNCAEAVTVGPTYEKCLDDVRTTPCSVFKTALENQTSAPLPTDCQGVIKVNQTP